MRISHLRQREPIEQIVADTLSKFWTSRFQSDYSADFSSAPPSANSTPWVCNAWLNIIFPPNARQDAFEPILREYSRSTVAWRRPLQKLYVRLATHRSLAKLLGHGTMNLNRVLPDQEDTIVVPGNNKVRILMRAQGCCYGLLKRDFPRERYLCELDARTAAFAAGVQVPALLERNDAAGWFREAYIAATPINRLASSEDQAQAAQEAAASLSQLTLGSRETISTAAYIDRCVTFAKTSLAGNELFTSNIERLLQSLLAHLSERIRRDGASELTTSATHGDFQPANILVNDQTWIIDWEYAARRQADFDAITYMSGARSPSGLAARLASLVARLSPEQEALVTAFGRPGIDWRHADERQSAVDIYLLEELCFHIQENDNPIFRKLNHGFDEFVNELEAWLA